MTKRIIIVAFFFYNFLIFNSVSVENKILFKINNEIISTIDIYNQITYLKLINANLKDVSQSNLYEIAKNSLIREKIKKIELSKNNIGLNVKEKDLNIIKKNFSNRLKLNSDKELNSFLKSLSLNEDYILKKLIIENLWNSLIVKKFLKDVKINKEKIKQKVSKINYQYEYNLSELIFELKNNENIDSKYNEIKKSIKKDSFEDVTALLSISDTSEAGGALGWIKENALSKIVKDALVDLNSGDITKPLVIPGGVLILKINNMRQVKKEINIQKEIQAVIRNKTNEQLNQFSVLYFNKIKKDILINEL